MLPQNQRFALITFRNAPFCAFWISVYKKMSPDATVFCTIITFENADFGPKKLSINALLAVYWLVYMHAWMNTLAREGLWLAHQLAAWTSRTTLISAITVLDSKGTHGFELVTMHLPKFAHDTYNLLTSALSAKAPYYFVIRRDSLMSSSNRNQHRSRHGRLSVRLGLVYPSARPTCWSTIHLLKQKMRHHALIL